MFEANEWPSDRASKKKSRAAAEARDLPIRDRRDPAGSVFSLSASAGRGGNNPDSKSMTLRRRQQKRSCRMSQTWKPNLTSWMRNWFGSCGGSRSIKKRDGCVVDGKMFAETYEDLCSCTQTTNTKKGGQRYTQCETSMEALSLSLSLLEIQYKMIKRVHSLQH